MISRQVVRGGKSVTAAANDDDVVAILEALGGAEHARFRVAASLE
jgi:hypothetical protein